MSRKTVFEMFQRVFWSSMEGIDGIDGLVKFLFEVSSIQSSRNRL